MLAFSRLLSIISIYPPQIVPTDFFDRIFNGSSPNRAIIYVDSWQRRIRDMYYLRTYKVAVVLAIFTIILNFALALADTEASVLSNLNLSKMTGYQAETTIAIDPTNPNRMFASSNVSSNGLFAAYSTDGGVIWQYVNPSKTIAAGGADGLPLACCDPSAVFDQCRSSV